MKPYEPAEDSRLLAAAVEKHASGKVLDMGTGSGIQAITAAKKKGVKSVIAADVNEEALKFAAAAAKGNSRIEFAKSDLFSNIRGKFDTIIFNPPYLPQDRGISDVAIYGGKHGYEVLERFIDDCGSHLNGNGIALVVFSSLTSKQKIDSAIESSCLEYEELSQQRISFETLYVYLIRKSRLWQQLERKGIKRIRLFAKGKRGVLYKGSCHGKAVVAKTKRKESRAVAAIENEIFWLKKLNSKGIGPKLSFSGSNWFAYGFVEGQFIADFISGCSKKEALGAIKQLLQQCRKLDLMKVNKEEMLRPYKHAIVSKKGKVTMIDFERCHVSARPKNVTQLCQFLISGLMDALLRQKGIVIDKDKLLETAKEYKNDYGLTSFKNVLKLT